MSESKKLTKLVIDRKRWIQHKFALADETDETNSQEGIDSVPAENMRFCAIGFVREEIGLSRSPTDFRSTRKIPHIGLEAVSEILVEKGLEWLVCPQRDSRGKIANFYYSQEAQEVMNLNDGHGDDQREHRLTELFAKHEITLTFTD